VDGALELRRFMPGGRGTWRAFSYKPQALQMILPLMSLRQRGVVVVPQFLQMIRTRVDEGKRERETYEHCWPDMEAERDSVVMVIEDSAWRNEAARWISLLQQETGHEDKSPALYIG